MRESIVVRGLGKRYRRYHVHRPLTLKEAFLRGFRGILPMERFWALRDVSFTVAPGHMVGVVGSNGAGKSTLLQLIGGIGLPDEGAIEVHGRIGALIDLDVGFHPDLTGRENVFLSGIIAGLTRSEVQLRFDSIVEFAELYEFIDSPLRTYSSGMKMRLGFSIAAHTKPDILLIDELLAVGDLSFQQKCLQQIARFKSAGSTILLVSHDISLIRQLCDETLWLYSGRLAAHGATDTVVSQYVGAIARETRRRTPATYPVSRTPAGVDLKVQENRFGSLEMEIVSVQLLTQSGNPSEVLHSGDPLRIAIAYRAPEPIGAPIFGVSITRDDGLVCYDTSTAAAGLTMPTIQGPGQIVLSLERLDLAKGLYYVDVGVYQKDWNYAYDYHWHVYPLTVETTGGEKGIIRPPHRWEVLGEPAAEATPKVEG